MSAVVPDLIAAGLYLIPALLWAIIAWQLWDYYRVRRPRSQYLRIAPALTGVIALHIFAHVVRVLLPAVVRDQSTGPAVLLHVVLEVSGLAGLTLGRHLIRLMPVPEVPPGRTWLAANYGLAAVAAATFALARLVPGTTATQEWLAFALLHGTVLALATLCVWQAVRNARPGAWGPESAGEIRRTDLVLVAGGLAAATGLLLVLAATGRLWFGIVVFEVVFSLAIAAPWALRMLGHVIPELVVTTTLLAATAAALVGYADLAARVDPAYRPLLAVLTALALGVVVMPGQTWLRASVERVVLRRSRRQQAELQAFLHALSPELGTLECCRRALAELVRVWQLTGAAIILRDGEAVVHGDFQLEPLRRVWPREAEADALPANSFGTAELRELPLTLREALIEANVGLGAAPILGPRRRWGHLFMNTGLLGGTFREDDAEAFRTFVAQLALLLDGTDLLARTVAVERSLAHAEKLAAIGELAARVAHEIRNPVTAARSLAQQLAREPGSPFAAEHAVILTELERVERQVAALLRFARREEFHFEAVDLGELVRTTIADLHPRLEAARVGVELDAAGDVTARADREKMRQVLVNLIENAIDALGDTTGSRRLAIGIARANGTATIRVQDNGPGVPADAVPRLFEPFFSLKAQGTGLGLAIARRTLEAHSGRIAAESGAGAGMTLCLELPLARQDRTT